MLDGAQIAGLLALGAFVFSLGAMRSLPRRESSVVASSPDMRVQSATGADRPRPGAELASPMVNRLPSGEPAGARDTGARGMARARNRDDDPPFRMQMNAHAHATEFVDWMRAMGFSGRYAAADVVDYYGWFTRDVRVFPIPEMKFLEALNKHPGVGKKRDRLKDAQGRVPKLPSGSPMRTMFYTIVEEQAAKLPSGVRAGLPAAPDTAVPKRTAHAAAPRAGHAATPRAGQRVAAAAPGKDDLVLGEERIAA